MSEWGIRKSDQVKNLVILDKSLKKEKAEGLMVEHNGALMREWVLKRKNLSSVPGSLASLQPIDLLLLSTSTPPYDDDDDGDE